MDTHDLISRTHKTYVTSKAAAAKTQGKVVVVKQ